VPGAFLPEVKQAGREADRSPSYGAEVRNARSYTATPLCVFMTWSFVKHADNFISFVRVEEAFVFWVMSSTLEMRPVCSFQTLATHVACYKVTIRNGSHSKEKFNVRVNPR
jgi:hypothetical protein